jgi:hypothetical protein
VARGLLFLLAFVALAGATVAFVFGTVVPVGSVGVRKVAFGPGQGLAARSLAPGFHWTIPGYSTIYLVPRTIRIIDFERDVKQYPRSFGSLTVPTTDGTRVDVDVAVVYRFFDHASSNPGDGVAHGGVSDLIQRVGPTDDQWRRFISQVASNEIKRALSALSTVDFYDPQLRGAQVAKAEAAMRAELGPLGVEVSAVLVRRYTYREEIDQAIFKKNLQELEMAFNKVAGEFAEAQRDVNKVESSGIVAIQNLDKQGISEAEKVRSEGDLYRREKVAQADLLLAEARAQVDLMRNEVLSQAGSDVYVALQLARVVGALKGGVVANIDPFDFNAWVARLLGVDDRKGEVERGNGYGRR